MNRPSELAIRVEGLGKRYVLGERRTRYKSLREALMRGVTAPARALRSLSGGGQRPKTSRESIWALRNVSFEIAPGEVVGIIGRNGAGKSTLLKILSRITDPTTGVAEIRGRVGSLLEVGTGFHPELTGTENIYLNGVILGMKRREVERKFDEIVAFADVEKFIDTPVKHYSSGMYLRLAFSVAAHLEPELLLLDEVLAVGDTAFQRKCFDKMEEVGKKGRTVLFISHSMPTVTRLCPRAILLDEGGVVADGPSREVVGRYLRSGLGTTAVREWPATGRAPGSSAVRLARVSVVDEAGRPSEAVDIRKPVILEMEYDVLESGWTLYPAFDLCNEDGICIFATIDLDPEWRGKKRPVGRWTSSVRIPGNFLAEGTILLDAYIITLHPRTKHLSERHAVAFQVVDSPAGDTARGDYAGQWDGVVRPLLAWTSHPVPSPAGSEVTRR